jgi:hypothetical protein
MAIVAAVLGAMALGSGESNDDAVSAAPVPRPGALAPHAPVLDAALRWIVGHYEYRRSVVPDLRYTATALWHHHPAGWPLVSRVLLWALRQGDAPTAAALVSVLAEHDGANAATRPEGHTVPTCDSRLSELTTVADVVHVADDDDDWTWSAPDGTSHGATVLGSDWLGTRRDADADALLAEALVAVPVAGAVPFTLTRSLRGSPVSRSWEGGLDPLRLLPAGAGAWTSHLMAHYERQWMDVWDAVPT